MTDTPPMLRISPDAPHYPALLAAALGSKAPSLSLVGNSALLDVPGIGFCGSRKASDKGLRTAVDCAEQAARAGLTVISGNAAGVDVAAHHAALAAGGGTILVLPEGLDHFRIRKNLRPVWNWQRVLVISQYEPAAPWQAWRAMSRNEVIIGLSRAMIVIEAGATGGTLNAGLSTLTAGKPLFVAIYEKLEETAPGNARL
ncbi:MAG: DNA-processing protein DprA, partial [Alphaproteobacteria bacterium]|nr:DNA-processing protein DprA [Alphaproteobacteria bacterium]